MVLLALRMGGLTAPSMRLLFWGTHAISAAILALSLAAPARYTSLRPHLLIPARAFFSLLCPQLVWQLARQQASAASHGQQSWPGALLGGRKELGVRWAEAAARCWDRCSPAPRLIPAPTCRLLLAVGHVDALGQRTADA